MIGNIIREKTHFTPYISFNAETGIFEIEGRSIPEVALNIYKPLIDYLDEYVKNPQSETVMFFKLSFFNTSTSKYILEILKKLEGIYKKGYSVNTFWYYEDDDMFELATDYQSLVEMPMSIEKTVFQ